MPVKIIIILLAATFLPATGASAALYRRDLFGLAPPPPAPAAEPEPEVVIPLSEPAAPDTLFTLIGFMAAAGEGEDRGLAVFLDLGTRQEGFYRVGDRIAGYRVEEIAESGVILESPFGVRYRVTAGGAQPLEGAPRFQRFRVRADLLLGRLEAQPGALDGLQARLEYRDGRPFGWRVTGLGSLPSLVGLGLRDNDIITAVNGVALEDGGEALEFYRSVLAGAVFEVRLSLVRDGRAHRIICYLE